MSKILKQAVNFEDKKYLSYFLYDLIDNGEDYNFNLYKNGEIFKDCLINYNGVSCMEFDINGYGDQDDIINIFEGDISKIKVNKNNVTIVC